MSIKMAQNEKYLDYIRAYTHMVKRNHGLFKVQTFQLFNKL